jgi:hypothetical protein
MGIGAALAFGTQIFGISEGRRAQKKAARDALRTARENAEFIQEQGRLGQQAIAESAEEAIARARGIPQAAISQIQPFQEVGTEAFLDAQRRILGGETGGGIAQSVAGAAGGALVPGQQLSPAVQAELQRQAGFIGESVAPQVSQQLLGLGGVGLGAAGDVAGITTRGAQRIGDIGAQAGAQQATALIGQVPQIAQQLQIGGEARLLGDISGQQAQTRTIEQLARLGGRLA